MKIKCKCGRILSLSPEKHAGKKVACKECGQRYRLPPAKAGESTMHVKAWRSEEEDKKEHEPTEVGAVPLGDKLSFTWVLLSLVITLVVGLGGAYGVKVGLTQLAAKQDMAKIAAYVKLAVWWGPMLAFVIAGWIAARLSPGRTIAEPAIGAALSVVVMLALVMFRPGPLETMLAGIAIPNVEEKTLPLLANLFTMAMFNAACLACAGAYFGEVAQERAKV